MKPNRAVCRLDRTLGKRKRRSHGGLGSMIAEKQTITVNVLDHETPDASTISVR